MSEQISSAPVDMLLDWRAANMPVSETESGMIHEAQCQIDAYYGRHYLDIQQSVAEETIAKLDTGRRRQAAQVAARVINKPLKTVYLATKSSL